MAAAGIVPRFMRPYKACALVLSRAAASSIVRSLSSSAKASTKAGRSCRITSKVDKMKACPAVPFFTAERRSDKSFKAPLPRCTKVFFLLSLEGNVKGTPFPAPSAVLGFVCKLNTRSRGLFFWWSHCRYLIWSAAALYCRLVVGLKFVLIIKKARSSADFSQIKKQIGKGLCLVLFGL